jgi:AcrR family transcriptional regulator
VPRIWEETVGAHRSAVQKAIAVATARVVQRDGIRGLTMSAIAVEAGIGRATLYRYVKDADAALTLWQEHGVEFHLRQLEDLATRTAPDRRLTVILEWYALNRQHRHGPAPEGVPHTELLVGPARGRVRQLLSKQLSSELQRGAIRTDMAPDLLAAYAVAALEAATEMPTPDAARRLAKLVHESLGANC